jgi:hypothetical protein
VVQLHDFLIPIDLYLSSQNNKHAVSLGGANMSQYQLAQLVTVRYLSKRIVCIV